MPTTDINLAASDGGNGASDGGKLVKFKSTGAIEGRCTATFGVKGSTISGYGIDGVATGEGTGASGVTNGTTADATGVLASGGTGAGAGLRASHTGTGPAVKVEHLGSGNILTAADLSETKFTIDNDGALNWTGAAASTAKSTTRTNLGLGALAIANVPVTVSAFAGTEVLASGALGYDIATEALFVGDGSSTVTAILAAKTRVYPSRNTIDGLLGNKQDALSGASLTAVTVSGTDKVLIQDADDSDNLKTVTAQSIADLGGGGSSMTLAVSQASHGLSVGDVVRHNGTIYVKAHANSAANAEVVGIVSAVADASNITIHVGGIITTLSGLTAGTTYFLDPSTAGAYTATEPSTVGQVSKPIFTAVSTTAAIWTNYRGIVIV